MPPAPGGGPGCAGDLFTVPVDGEAGLVEPLPRGGLPAGVGLQRCDQGDAVFGAGGLDGFGIGIAGVDQMLGGGQGAGGEAGMDPGQGASVVHRAEGALGVGDEAVIGQVRTAVAEHQGRGAREIPRRADGGIEGAGDRYDGHHEGAVDLGDQCLEAVGGVDAQRSGRLGAVRAGPRIVRIFVYPVGDFLSPEKRGRRGALA